MNRKTIADLRRRTEQLRDQLVAAQQQTAIAIERERKDMREKLGRHATDDAINHRVREMRAAALQPFERVARELLMDAPLIEAHATGLKDRERLLRTRPAPMVEPEIPSFIDTTDGARMFLATARVLYDAITAQTFHQSLPRYTLDELEAVATDAAAQRDYATFAAVRRELRSRPATDKEAGRARTRVEVMLAALPLPPDDEAQIEDATAYGQAATEIEQGLHALRTGDESVQRAEGIRLIKELGPEGFSAVRAGRREERERAAGTARREPPAPRFKLPIAGADSTDPKPAA